MAHKSDLGAVLDLVILAKCWSRSSFLLLLFGALSFENQAESVQALLNQSCSTHLGLHNGEIG